MGFTGRPYWSRDALVIIPDDMHAQYRLWQLTGSNFWRRAYLANLNQLRALGSQTSQLICSTLVLHAYRLGAGTDLWEHDDIRPFTGYYGFFPPAMQVDIRRAMYFPDTLASSPALEIVSP